MLAATPGTVVTVSGQWAAIDRGSSCEAVTRALASGSSNTAATAGLRFTPDRRQWGQFHVALSRVPRSGSSVMLTVGRQRFLLVSRGRDAWSRGTGQDQAIIEALRGAASFHASARDLAGRRFTDRFEGRGAPTAIDSAAARCALRAAGKIR